MTVAYVCFLALLAATSLTITEPRDGETYDGDWLPLRVIVENENELPDSVHYTLNDGAPVLIPRLNTDWYTYMGNDLHTGYSESPAPHDATILWTAPVTSTIHEFPNPVVVDGIVYYPSNKGSDSLYALDAANGESIWKYRVGETDDAVTVENGRLYIASDSLWCLDSMTGERLWATSQADGSGSTPVVAEGMVFAGKYVYTPYTNRVSAFDGATGKWIWETWNAGPGGRMVSCMTFWEGMLFVPSYGSVGGSLTCLDAANGETLWTNTDAAEGYWDSSPVVVDGILYIGGVDGCLRAVDCWNGETIWVTPLASDGWITATPSYHDGCIYVGTDTGPFVRVDASTGAIHWPADFPIHGSPCVADGLVLFGEYLTGEKARVIALDCMTGGMVWGYTVEANRFHSTPAVTDGVMYIAALDGLLYAFGTGLKYSYREDYFYAEVGPNTLIVTSFDEGEPVAADTISFTVTGTGFGTEPSPRLRLTVSPNPFHSAGSIAFELTDPGYTSLEIYDLAGRVVWSRASGLLDAGQHSYAWDGRGETGELLSSGLYLCRIRSGETSETTGMCLLR